MPPHITCPPDICVDCEYAFDITKLENYFGTVVQGEENVKTNTIYGDWGSLYIRTEDDCRKPVKNFKFQDGWAHDNCNLTIKPTYIDERDQCGEGNIVREFTASDPNGTVKCKQYIHFYNPDPFDREDITWPIDRTIFGCKDEALYDLMLRDGLYCQRMPAIWLPQIMKTLYIISMMMIMMQMKYASR